MKTITIAELGQDGASRAIGEAEREPVLIKREAEPVAWIISAERLSQAGATAGGERTLYQSALALIAVDLYEQELLTLAQGARLAGIALGDFIDLCSRLSVPILWEPARGIEAEVDALDAVLPTEQDRA